MIYSEYLQNKLPERYIKIIEELLEEDDLPSALIWLDALGRHFADSDFFCRDRKNKKLIKRLLYLFLLTYDKLGIKKEGVREISPLFQVPYEETSFGLLMSIMDFMKIFSDFVFSLDYYDNPVDKSFVIKIIRKALNDNYYIEMFIEIIEAEFDDFEKFKKEKIKDIMNTVA